MRKTLRMPMQGAQDTDGFKNGDEKGEPLSGRPGECDALGVLGLRSVGGDRAVQRESQGGIWVYKTGHSTEMWLRGPPAQRN